MTSALRSRILSPMTTDNKELWTLGPADVAKQLGVATATVVSWADADKIPCWRTPGGNRRFRQADVDALLPAAPILGKRTAD